MTHETDIPATFIQALISTPRGVDSNSWTVSNHRGERKQHVFIQSGQLTENKETLSRVSILTSSRKVSGKVEFRGVARVDELGLRSRSIDLGNQ